MARKPFAPMSSGSESDGASSDFSYEKAPKRAPTKRKSRKASEATSARQGVVESVEDGLFGMARVNIRGFEVIVVQCLLYPASGTVRNGSLTALKNAAQAWASGYEVNCRLAVFRVMVLFGSRHSACHRMTATQP